MNNLEHVKFYVLLVGWTGRWVVFSVVTVLGIIMVQCETSVIMPQLCRCVLNVCVCGSVCGAACAVCSVCDLCLAVGHEAGLRCVCTLNGRRVGSWQ